MSTSRALTILAALALTAASCAGSAGGDASSDERSGEVTETTALEGGAGDTAPSTTAPTTTGEETSTAPTPTTAAPATATTTPSSAAPAVDDGWAEQLVGAFVDDEAERERLDAETGAMLRALPPDPTEQDSWAIFAVQDRGLADAGDRLLGEIPDVVPADADAAYRSTIEAFEALVLQRRAAADGLDAGDVSAKNLVRPMLETFYGACAELQFDVLDLGHGFLPCGIPNESPEEIPGVANPTTDDMGDNAATLELPPGDHVLGYLDQVVDDVANGIPELPLRVDLSYDQALTVTSSRHLIELAVPDGGPSLRVHTNGYVADPTRLESDEVPSYWPVPDGPGGWTGALEGVRVDATGTGSIAGVDGEYWELTSERDDPIAILGDWQGGVPDTVLEPGGAIRLWWILIRDKSMLITEHPAPGTTLADAEAELAVLRDGLLSIAAG